MSPKTTVYRPSQETLAAPVSSLPKMDRWINASLGKYRISRRIGQGGMGVVYQALDPLLLRSVAIKLLPEDLCTDAEALRKFLGEARAAARISHPNVVSVYEANQENGVSYLVMELMEGGSAQDRLRAWGAFPWAEATRTIIAACRGLSAVHAAGLVHRDIKPSNIMRGADGTIKIADFGLALVQTGINEAGRQLGQLVGTPFYMSPEQCRGKMADARSDFYSLGITYYTLLTDRVPFDGSDPHEVLSAHCYAPIPDPRQLVPTIPSACTDLLRWLLAKNPDNRPQSAEELILSLEKVLGPEELGDTEPLEWATAVEIDPFDRTVIDQRKVRKQGTRWWLVALCVALMGLTFWMGREWGHWNLGGSSNSGTPEEKTGPLMLTLVHEWDVESIPETVGFDPLNRGSIAYGTDQGHLGLIDINGQSSFKHKFDRAPWQQLSVQPLVLSPVEPLLTTAFDGRLRFFDIHGNRERGDLGDNDPAGQVKELASNPRKNIVAAMVLRSGQFHVLTKTGKDNLHEVSRQDRFLNSLGYNADGTVLGVLRTFDNTVLRWNEQDETLPDVHLGEEKVEQVAFIGNDALAILRSQRIELWDLAKGELSKTIADNPTPKFPLRLLTSSSNGGRLAWFCNGIIYVYDVPTGRSATTSNGNDEKAVSLSINETGTQIVAGSENAKIRVWSISK